MSTGGPARLNAANMNDADPITHWLREVQAGRSDAAQGLWNAYFDRLTTIARQKLPIHARRAADDEDVALSAFKSLCLGLERGRYPQVQDREELWNLLIVITARKAVTHVRHETRQKRGGGHVQGEAALASESSDGGGFDQIVGREPTPEFAAQVAEQCERLMAALGDDALRGIAMMKLEGFTREEIAERLGRSVRSIARRLDLIRRIWIEHGLVDTPND